MRICIPTEDDRGMDSRVSDHFGSAPCFTFFDTATGGLDVRANAHEEHEPGQCNPTAAVRSGAARVIVCRGLGRRALERLQESGIEVFVTRETTTRSALEAYAAGRLDAMNPGQACGGHQDCDHHGPAGH